MRIVFILVLILVLNRGDAQSQKVNIRGFTQSTGIPYGDPFRINTRIVDQKEYGKTFSIKIGASSTCCTTFKPFAFLSSNGLYLSCEETSAVCDNTCYYELTFDLEQIDGHIAEVYFQNEPVRISPEKFKTFEVSYVIFNNDTVGLEDNYGRKQGKWHLAKNIPVTSAFLEYKNDTLIRQVHLYANGQIKSEVLSGKVKVQDSDSITWLFTYGNRYLEYFASGLRKKECMGKTLQSWYWDGICKEWNEKGEVVYEGKYRK